MYSFAVCGQCRKLFAEGRSVIVVNLGKIGRVKIVRPTASEIVAFIIVVAVLGSVVVWALTRLRAGTAYLP
jgi:hypothetical protein